MKKIIDSVSAAAAEKAAEATKEVLSGFKPAERLILVGFALIGLAIVSADGEDEKQKDSRKSH